MSVNIKKNNDIDGDVEQEPIVKIRGLRYARADNVIFNDIDIDIKRGQITAIMGPSGTGKTTLLRLIGGQLKPHAGTILVDGENISKLRHKELYQLRKRISLLFQNGALFTDINVFDNVAFPLREHTALPESLIRSLVLMKLESVGLRGAMKLMPNELSGGMARRVALARAIALDPMMVMYDEPFTGQDPITMGVLVALLRSLNENLRLTSILVSHDVQESLAIADYVYLISNGKVVEHGTPTAINSSQSAWVQQFLQGKEDGPVSFHYRAPNISQQLLG